MQVCMSDLRKPLGLSFAERHCIMASEAQEETGLQLTSLPRGVVVKILHNLNPFALLQAACVCQTLRSAADEALACITALSLSGLDGQRVCGACSWLASNGQKLRGVQALELEGEPWFCSERMA